MSFSVFPDFIAIGGLVAVFSSLLYRTHQTRLRYWLLGWVFILIHFAVRAAAENISSGASAAEAIAISMLLLSSVAFLWAGNDTRPIVSKGPIVTLLGAAPDVAFCVILVYGLTSLPLYFSLTAAGALASIWVHGSGRRKHDRPEQLARLGFILAAYAIQGILLYLGLFDAALVWLLFWHFLATAITFRLGSKATVGVVFTTLSFVAWALVFPIGLALTYWLPRVHVESDVWNLPKYLVATGMIVTLLEEQIFHAEQASLHDDLTGLANRRLFGRSLNKAFENTRRTGLAFAFMIVDIDHLKQINDTLGHTAGDEILRLAARRFLRCMRREDTLARLGGDEFAAILPGIADPAAAGKVLDKLQTALRQPFLIGGHEHTVSASIGFALSPGEGTDEKTLYALADRRMYTAKYSTRVRRGDDRRAEPNWKPIPPIQE